MSSKPTKYYEASSDPSRSDWWSVIVDTVEQRQEWAIIHMIKDQTYEVWANGQHYDTARTPHEAEAMMQQARQYFAQGRL